MSAADGPRLPEVPSAHRRALAAILGALRATWAFLVRVVGAPVRAVDGFIRRGVTAPRAETVDDHGARRGNARARRRWWVVQIGPSTVIVAGAVVAVVGTSIGKGADMWVAFVYGGAALLWWVTSYLLTRGQVMAYRMGYTAGRTQVLADLLADVDSPVLLDYERADPHPVDPAVAWPEPRVVSNANPDR